MTLAQRDDDLRELMDDPGCDPVALRRTLARFGLVNRLVSGWGAVYRARIRPVIAANGGRARLLDIGCGGGDVLRRLVEAAHRDGFEIEGTGIDPDAAAIEVATRRPSAGLSFRRAHSDALIAAGETFDIVVSNHVLHHLTRAEIPGFLASSAALSTGVAIHSDIARGRIAYGAYAVGVTPIAAGTFLRTDGLRSIRRAFTSAELRAITPPTWSIAAPGPFRLLVVREAGANA